MPKTMDAKIRSCKRLNVAGTLLNYINELTGMACIPKIFRVSFKIYVFQTYEQSGGYNEFCHFADDIVLVNVHLYFAALDSESNKKHFLLLPTLSKERSKKRFTSI